MGKSESGPGMLDCLMYLRQMDDQAGCYTTVMLLPSGSQIAPSVTISLMSTPVQGRAMEVAALVTTYEGWPSREHKAFTSALYRAIVEHDKRTSADAVWKTPGFFD